MKKALLKLMGVLMALLSLAVIFLVPSSAADDGWTYAAKLPSNVTAADYYIEYKHTYKTVAKDSPGSGWVNKGLNKTVYENSGSPYQSAIELETSETRALVSYYYYHWCSNSGVRVNFAQLDSYNHYDGISPDGSFYEAGQYNDDDDPRYKSYWLKYHDGSNVYCYSGFSCDGAWGSHGGRSYVWYKMCTYQDKVRVDYYDFEKQGEWTDKYDSSAASCTVRYKIRHTHSYSGWAVSKKATFTSDGSKYRVCKTCKAKQTAKIYKASSVKLSGTSFAYNGKAKKPTVTVKDSKGTVIKDSKYTLSYSKGRKNIGTYKVTVKLKGAYYTGTKTLSFKIVPGQVKNLKATAKKNAVTLNWSKVSGAAKYKVYAYNTSSKKLTLLATTEKTTYTQKSLKSKNTYSYVVKAYKKVGKKEYYGKQSAVVKKQPYGTPAKVTGLTASSKTSFSVTLKWKKAAGNNVKYYVYSYNPSTKKYTKLGVTASTSYKVKSLKANTSYKYSVRAYSPAGKNKGYFGQRSDIFTVKTNKKLTSPAVSGFTASTEKKLKNILISWKADTSVKSFQIYRSTSTKSDSFKLLATVSSSTGSYRDTSVSPGVTYYYKMRTYKVSGEESAYGTFTKLLKITSYGAWRENLGISDFTYSFSNSYRGFGYPTDYSIPLSSYQLIFGNTELAQQMYEKYGKWGGNCHGLSATSAMLNMRSSGVTPAMFNTSASRVKDLNVNDTGSLGISVRQFIEAMQVSQLSSNIYSNRVWDDLDSLLKEVCWVPYTGKPVIIGVRNDAQGVSHALLAFRAVKVSDTQINIELYDSNYPDSLRNLILYVNSAGKVTGWYYEVDDNRTVGSGYLTSRIEYLTYDVYSAMWTDRGSFTSGMAQSNALMVNSDFISIYDENDNLIATMSDGELISDDEGIYVVDTEDVCGTDEEAPAMLYLPSDKTYTVVNNDASVETFEATMVNVERSAEVSTESDTVTFTVSDSVQANEVSVEADKNDKFSIVLSSSDNTDEEQLEIIGEGEGEIVAASQNEGEISLQGCDNAEVYVDKASSPLSREQIEEITN
ncbi:MAG: fibronectin type III domain-containing protein [Clostridia bacterium]|nr:fibronectin type III domain-containing protein [Clostridia bacterium]